MQLVFCCKCNVAGMLQKCCKIESPKKNVAGMLQKCCSFFLQHFCNILVAAKMLQGSFSHPSPRVASLFTFAFFSQSRNFAQQIQTRGALCRHSRHRAATSFDKELEELARPTFLAPPEALGWRECSRGAPSKTHTHHLPREYRSSYWQKLVR